MAKSKTSDAILFTSTMLDILFDIETNMIIKGFKSGLYRPTYTNILGMVYFDVNESILKIIVEILGRYPLIHTKNKGILVMYHDGTTYINTGSKSVYLSEDQFRQIIMRFIRHHVRLTIHNNISIISQR